MRKWIFELGLRGAVSAPFTQAASPVSATPLNLETATVRVAPSPLPDEQSHALSFFEASQLRGRVMPSIVGVPRLAWPSRAFTGRSMCPTMRQNRLPLSTGSLGGQR